MVVWMNVYFFVLKKVGLYGVCLVLVDVVDVLLVVVVDGDDECRLQLVIDVIGMSVIDVCRKW